MAMKLTLPFGLLVIESNLMRGVPPWASTRLISSTKSGANRMIMENATGLLPATKLNFSSTAGAAAVVAADVAGAELRPRWLEPPRERRLAGAEERCGGGKEARPSLAAPAPRPAPPPIRPCLDEPPYIGESFRETEGNGIFASSA